MKPFNGNVLHPRPYIDVRQYALEVELPNQASQPRRELPTPTSEQISHAGRAHRRWLICRSAGWRAVRYFQ
jgi:hypothetical protein